LLLVLGLALGLGLGAGCRTSTPRSAGPTDPRELARELFRELIELDTTEHQGSGRAAQAMARRLRAAGFPAGDVVLAGPRPRNLNLVVRYRAASSARRPILIFGHLDVVEARRSDWSLDPFTFVEKDGFYYGRGAEDMKYEDAEIVANLIRLRREGFVPARDLIVALTDHEEAGDANGVEWLLAHRRELIDAELAINLEGGGGDLRGGKRILMEVQTSEKVYVSFRLEARESGGHSSMPVRENAIYRLAAGLGRLAGFAFPLQLSETTRAFFARAAEPRARADVARMLAAPMDPAAAERVAGTSAYYNAMLRTTCVATRLEGGHADNALPQTARALINCRLLPGEPVAQVLATLRRVLADPKIAVTQLEAAVAAPASPIHAELFGAVERITGAMWPGVPVAPVMSTSATDGRFLRRAGIPTYGVSGMFLDIDDVRSHGKDERIAVESFHAGVEFMYRLLKVLVGPAR